MDAASTVSGGAVGLYQALSNPKAVTGDSGKPAETILSQLERNVGDEVRSEAGRAPPGPPSITSSDSEEEEPHAMPVHAFSDAMSQEEREGARPAPQFHVPYGAEEPPSPPSPSPPPSPKRHHHGGGERRWSNIFQQTAYNPADFADIDADKENKDPKIRREKQEVLFQLLKDYPDERMHWSLRMPLFELKYELHRRQQLREEQEQVELMKDLLKLVLSGIEFANAKIFNNILELKGWSSAVTQDMSRYDRCLRALYQRYFRRKRMNPVLELLWLVAGSAVMWHVQRRFLGQDPAAAAAGNASAPAGNFANNFGDIRQPPHQRFPFDQPGPAAGMPSVNLSDVLGMFAGMGGGRKN